VLAALLAFVAAVPVVAGPGDLVRVPCARPAAVVSGGIDDPLGRPLRERLPLVRSYYWSLDGQVAVARLGRTHVRNLDDDATITLTCR
jgi:hypothetical protein